MTPWLHIQEEAQVEVLAGDSELRRGNVNALLIAQRMHKKERRPLRQMEQFVICRNLVLLLIYEL